MTAKVLSFLLLDDDKLLREITKKILHSFGAGTILESADGANALQIVRSAKERAKKIDIIFCDLNMPGMDGMEFLRHLGELKNDSFVVLVSAHDDMLISSVAKMAEAYGLKILGCIRKPILKDHVEQVISNYETIHQKKSSGRLPYMPPKYTIEEILDGIRLKQFEPYYQPKIKIGTGSLCGVEALARWMHPQDGIVTPASFIAPLEKNSHTDELTFLMLEKAAEACKRFHDAGHVISVSVNLSSDLLTNTSIATRLEKIVRDKGVSPEYIIFEITETVAMTDVAHTLENLTRLKMHGFGLSVDDYGTGFSNVQQITRVSFSELKIDRFFVSGCTNSKNLASIVETCIDMAHKLKIECVAEGVETKQDWDTLKDLRCDIAQGYYIAQPMDFDSTLKFCAENAQKIAV